MAICVFFDRKTVLTNLLYSYLGLGLMAARMDVFLKENDVDSLNIKTSCVHPSVKNATWKYVGKAFSVG